jgi:hypothetical protein
MEGRVLGCKLTGCLFGALLVFGLFGAMLRFADTGARTALTRRQIADADLDLPLLYDGLRRLANDNNGKLPALDTPEQLKAALYPRYIAFEEAFTRFGDKTPYMPVPDLSGKKWATLPKTEGYLLYESQPVRATAATPAPGRALLRTNGSVARVSEAEWKALGIGY